MKKLLRILPLLTLVTSPLVAEEIDPLAAARSANLATVTNLWRTNRSRSVNDANFVTRRGLTADIAARTIEILAEATPIDGGVVEFFIVGEHSGHDYEALVTSFAKPSDIEAVLQQLGMQPGQPVNPKTMRFWPKGERVNITVQPYHTNTPPLRLESMVLNADTNTPPLRLESMVLNADTKRPLPDTGFIFCKLLRRKLPNGLDQCIADVDDPGSIASTYNEPTTLFDVPRKAPQAEVYEKNSVNPKTRFAPGTLLKLTITPQSTPDKRRVRDYTFKLTPDAKGNGVAGAHIALINGAGQTLPAKTLKEIVLSLKADVEKGLDPYLILNIAPDVPIQAIYDFATILNQIEGERGIRMEPPLNRHLYYRAYIPQLLYRDRKSRTAQPWELKLEKSNGVISAKLIQIKEQSPLSTTIRKSLPAWMA